MFSFLLRVRRKISYENCRQPGSRDTGRNLKRERDRQPSRKGSIKSLISPFKPRKESSCLRISGRPTLRLRDRRKPSTASEGLFDDLLPDPSLQPIYCLIVSSLSLPMTMERHHVSPCRFVNFQHVKPTPLKT